MLVSSERLLSFEQQPFRDHQWRASKYRNWPVNVKFIEPNFETLSDLVQRFQFILTMIEAREVF